LVKPPLPYKDASFDAIYAISIWSHFSEAAALRWLDEMHRILRPGGHLVLTTHGYHTVAFYDRQQVYPESRLNEIMDALYRSGYWFDSVFGREGDAGVVDSGWGMSFLTPEWMLTRACPPWRVVEFAAGRNEGNQDVFVLEKGEPLSAESVASHPEEVSSNATKATLQSSSLPR
jgi:SAM-dependent methyltransferase